MSYNKKQIKQHRVQIDKIESTKGLEGKEFIVNEIIYKKPKPTLATVIEMLTKQGNRLDSIEATLIKHGKRLDGLDTKLNTMIRVNNLKTE